jgi:lysophospholipase L1-like esterase
MFTINPGMRLGIIGTSLTAGGLPNTQPRGWFCDIFGIGGRAFAAPTSGNPTGVSVGSLARGSVFPPITPHRPIIAEIGGAKVADNLASWATLVTAYNPLDAVIIEGNINDVIAATNQTTFTTQVNQMLDLANSYAQVYWMAAILGDISNGENDTLFGNAFNLSIDTYNTIVQTQIGLRSSKFTYCNVRPDFKAWETANNSAHVGQGLLTVDGVHLTEYGLGILAKAARSSVQWAA